MKGYVRFCGYRESKKTNDLDSKKMDCNEICNQTAQVAQLSQTDRDAG